MKLEAKLDNLSKRQLIELILEAIAMGCPLTPSIEKMLEPPALQQAPESPPVPGPRSAPPKVTSLSLSLSLSLAKMNK